MPYRDYTSLNFEFPEPGILRIVFDNPKSRNSVSAEQHTELARIWGDIDRDPDVKVVIVTGAGDAFSSGGDFGMIEEMTESFEGRILTMREARDICYGVINCSKPIVSAMTGPAVGAGLAVGLLADVSIATPSTKIVDGHTRLGVAARAHIHAVMSAKEMTGKRADDGKDEADNQADQVENHKPSPGFNRRSK